MEEKIEDVTYEEWKSASRFARVRYKYGLYVLIACWVCLALLIYFVIHYSTEISTHPGTYLLHKLDATSCICYGDRGTTYLINSTDISYINIP